MLEVYGDGAVEQAVEMRMGCGFVTRPLLRASLARQGGVREVAVKGLSLGRTVYAVRRRVETPAPVSSRSLIWRVRCPGLSRMK